MKTFPIYFLIFFLLTTNHCISQDSSNNYSDLNAKALNYYNQKNYLQAATLFSKAYKIAHKNYKGYEAPRYEAAYNAACCWALSGQHDSAINELYKIAKQGRLTDYKLITTDDDLKSLHDKAKWKEICDLVKTNEQKSKANLDTTLVAELKQIRKEDQQYRLQADTAKNRNIKDSLWKIIRVKDSINLIAVKKILDKYGWLGPDKIGTMGSQTLWLVIQHANLKTQQQYLPMIQAAVKNGKALPKELAFLEDRISLREGKKQIYGTQLFTDESGTYVQPLIDPENVDKRRASVWLESISEYIGEKWNPKKYVLMLPEIEAKIKAKKK